MGKLIPEEPQLVGDGRGFEAEMFWEDLELGFRAFNTRRNAPW